MVKTESNNPHTQARGHFFHRDAMGKPLATVVIIDCQRFWTFFSIPHAHMQVTSTHTSLSRLKYPFSTRASYFCTQEAESARSVRYLHVLYTSPSCLEVAEQADCAGPCLPFRFFSSAAPVASRTNKYSRARTTFN